MLSTQDKMELKKWIEKLRSIEGRSSFKNTMKCKDEDVDYEISLAERVLKEDEDYYEMMMARSSDK